MLLDLLTVPDLRAEAECVLERCVTKVDAPLASRCSRSAFVQWASRIKRGLCWL